MNKDPDGHINSGVSRINWIHIRVQMVAVNVYTYTITAYLQTLDVVSHFEAMGNDHCSPGLQKCQQIK